MGWFGLNLIAEEENSEQCRNPRKTSRNTDLSVHSRKYWPYLCLSVKIQRDKRFEVRGRWHGVEVGAWCWRPVMSSDSWVNVEVKPGKPVSILMKKLMSLRLSLIVGILNARKWPANDMKLNMAVMSKVGKRRLKRLWNELNMFQGRFGKRLKAGTAP